MKTDFPITEEPAIAVSGGYVQANIGVCALDGKYPNLAIMKICGYHESIGDAVSWYNGHLFADQYDKIYFSKIFSFTEMPQLPPNAVIGGTGIDFMNKLPEEIENATPSYTLFPDCNYHIGFSMKGCRFNCKFCCVPKKEGRPFVYNSIDEILINPNGGNRLMLLDNDFFGGDNWEGNLNRIIELKLKVCFVQGLNIRIITPDQASLLAKCNYQNSKFNQKYLTFAWDKFKDESIVMKGIEICNNAGIPTKHMQFFVLIGFDTTPDQDQHRVEMLRNLGAMPFVMPYNKDDKYQKAYTRYVNNRAVFKSVRWSEYEYNPNRVRRSIACT
ncbi:hypothetical protein [Flavobacterium sp.]|uniref:hypothetical protein n=1 Tax=Flavobacterium sp. TaxID=239 RepID=UPI00121A932C|nr:hypothetical protein [Flavobacterium sp.]RZJ70415.1 MAG: hypothetical protein EOO49_14135 [Flavobacterium sp.]